MISNNIYIRPSLYEAHFLFTTHTTDSIQKTIETIKAITKLNDFH